MADKPVTREEKYLAYLTGDYKGEIPKPITRKEKYLYELCLKGMDGEISPEEIKNAVNEYLEKNPVNPGATTEQAQQIEQNKTDIASLKGDLSDLAPAGAAVGQLFRVAAISEDGKYTMEPVDMLDVRVDGESIVKDLVAHIPIVKNVGEYGLVKFGETKKSSIYFDSNGNMIVANASTTQINKRTVYPIFPNILDYAVKAAMCDGKGDAWTDAERIAALLRMGCTVDENGFVKWTAQEVTE